MSFYQSGVVPHIIVDPVDTSALGQAWVEQRQLRTLDEPNKEGLRDLVEQLRLTDLTLRAAFGIDPGADAGNIAREDF